jgi:hypothetical protein
MTRPDTDVSEDGWKSIGSAPTDGTKFDVWLVGKEPIRHLLAPYRHANCWYKALHIFQPLYEVPKEGFVLVDGFGQLDKDYVATHWRKLPDGPES